MRTHNNSLSLERIQIDIDPSTGQYSLDIQGVNINRLYAVISDIKEKLEDGLDGFNSHNVEIIDGNTGRELTDEERAAVIEGLGKPKN